MRPALKWLIVAVWVVIVALWGVLIWAYAVHAAEPVSTPLMWNGLVVAPERRCAPYDPKAYHYPADIERRILTQQGLVSFYTGRTFTSTKQTDVEHVLSRREAHDSGMCALSDSVKRVFASDLINLTLAAPAVNRFQKRDKDVSQWRPELVGSWCWHASTIVRTKRKYRLSADSLEVVALQDMLRTCNRE